MLLNTPFSDSVSLRLRDFYHLTSQHIITRRLIMQKARSHTLTSAPTACKLSVSGSISLPSRGSFHRSFTVLFSIGHQVVFRLGGWAPRLLIGFHVSDDTLDSLSSLPVSPTGLSPSLIRLPNRFGYISRYTLESLTL